MLEPMCVGLGGGLGAMARYGVGGIVLHLYPNLKFPLGTFTVNFLGCLFIGSLAALAEKHHLLGANMKLFLITGFLGGFTTFSSFGYETLFLARRDELAMAGINVVLSVACCLGAVWMGLRLVR